MRVKDGRLRSEPRLIVSRSKPQILETERIYVTQGAEGLYVERRINFDTFTARLEEPFPDVTFVLLLYLDRVKLLPNLPALCQSLSERR